METRLYNIFKSKNAAKLIKPIIESSCKVLLDKILFATINVQFQLTAIGLRHIDVTEHFGLRETGR